MSMFKATTACSLLDSAGNAAAECIAQIEDATTSAPSIVIVMANSALSLGGLADALSRRWPGVRIHASTSCLGAMTESNVVMSPTAGVAMLAITDPAGDFGVAAGGLEAGVQPSAARLVRQALADAGRAGEIPALVLVSVTPGAEEQFIAGLQAVVGPDTTIVGGSAADNNLSGAWRVQSQDFGTSSGAVVSVLFPSVAVSTAFESGYAPTDHRGLITRAEGRRVIEIDHEPAATVYERWTGGGIARPLAGTVNILAASALMPLGRVASRLDDMPIYKLSHPETVAADGSMTLFTAVAEGEELLMMRGTPATLIARASSVVRSARRIGDVESSEISAVLMFYCGGCMLQISDRIDEIRQSLAQAITDKPIVVGFTFGEQGPITLGPVEHGNLMISAIVFGR